MRVNFIKRMTRNASFHLIREKFILIFRMSDGMDSISSELHIKKNLSFLLKRTELLIKDQNNNNTYIEVQSIDIWALEQDSRRIH